MRKQILPKENRKGSLAAAGECYCTRLFQLAESFAGLTPEERYAKRLEQEKPVLDALLAWAKEAASKTAPKSALGKTLHYLLEQWPYLVRSLEDGRLELSNNRAERSIKPFVMGRKNWLFANTPAGAQSSAVIYSLIETAKENKLDPYRYLLWVLQSAPTLSQADAFWAEKLLPANAPQECRLPQRMDVLSRRRSTQRLLRGITSSLHLIGFRGIGVSAIHCMPMMAHPFLAAHTGKCYTTAIANS